MRNMESNTAIMEATKMDYKQEDIAQHGIENKFTECRPEAKPTTREETFYIAQSTFVAVRTISQMEVQ